MLPIVPIFTVRYGRIQPKKNIIMVLVLRGILAQLRSLTSWKKKSLQHSFIPSIFKYLVALSILQLQ